VCPGINDTSNAGTHAQRDRSAGPGRTSPADRERRSSPADAFDHDTAIHDTAIHDATVHDADIRHASADEASAGHRP
jgi:hypothetical protein